jgi:hypothetical protein
MSILAFCSRSRFAEAVCIFHVFAMSSFKTFDDFDNTKLARSS